MRAIGDLSYTPRRGYERSDSGEGGVAISARLRRTPAHWYLYFGIGVSVALSAAFGGWQAVAQPKVELKPGVVDAGKPWNVKVVTARLLQDLEPAVYLQNKEDHWLAVIAEVEITDDHSHIDVNRIIRIPTATGIVIDSPSGTSFDEYPYEVLLARDGTRVESLHPGMTERVAFLWEQKPDALPNQIDVNIMGMTWRKNSLTDSYEWLDEAVRASLTVPVEDKRNG
jgi:hypothetical protein